MIAVHATNPAVDFAQWQSDLAEIRKQAEAHVGGPLVVLGDFNAVREHQPLRAFGDAGLTSAAESAGAGWVPTWPSRRYDRTIAAVPYPPVIGIDHVFVGPGVVGVRVGRLWWIAPITWGWSLSWRWRGGGEALCEPRQLRMQSLPHDSGVQSKSSARTTSVCRRNAP